MTTWRFVVHTIKLYEDINEYSGIIDMVNVPYG